MTYKQFQDWCNERACDGMWGINTALTCIELMKQVNKKAFWKREKEWQKLNHELKIEEIFVKPKKLIGEK